MIWAPKSSNSTTTTILLTEAHTATLGLALLVAWSFPQETSHHPCFSLGFRWILAFTLEASHITLCGWTWNKWPCHTLSDISIFLETSMKSKLSDYKLYKKSVMWMTLRFPTGMSPSKPQLQWSKFSNAWTLEYEFWENNSQVILKELSSKLKEYSDVIDVVSFSCLPNEPKAKRTRAEKKINKLAIWPEKKKNSIKCCKGG